MNRFFAAEGDIDRDGGIIILKGDNAVHASNVLRLRHGDEIIVCDGKKNDYLCRVSEASSKKGVAADIKEVRVNQNEPDTRIYLYQGIPKSDKLEQVIQKAVELGVYCVIPTETEHSVVRADSINGGKLDRLRKISEAAAKQSHRGIIPDISSAVRFREALTSLKEKGFHLCVAAYENEKQFGIRAAINKSVHGKPAKIAVFVGPEGGFSGNEAAMMNESGISLVTLGPRVLRTETAGPAVLAVILHELGDLG